ncbi:helix-turn-helix transcriptional regulator [Paraburkholderia fungorum]|uniref:helix-turn-helix domain-containing protein n=2 Tax=Paraburkholderia fungorum TaxID=134537 RepID=UPI0038B85E92
MLDISSIKLIMSVLTNMKVTQASALAPSLLEQSRRLGELLARLRIARGVKQTDAALRAGLSRNTAYRLEHGDPGLAIGQVLRYLDAIAPGTSLEILYSEKDPALAALAARERRSRVREMSAAERDELNF